jgi:Fe-S cluster assembly protein SufD
MSFLESVRSRLAVPCADPRAEAARQALLADGFPMARTESWRYSPLRAVDDAKLDPPGAVDDSTAWPAPIDDAALQFEPNTVADPIRGAPSAFAQLTVALSAPCARLAIEARGLRQRLHLPAPSGGYLGQRLEIDIAPGADVVLVEDLTQGTADALVNRWLVVRIGSGAQVRWHRWQRQSARLVQRTDLYLAPDSRLDYVALETGARFSRHDLDIRLDTNAQVDLKGLIAIDGRQHQDTQLRLRHAGGARSETLWRIVAADRARGVFDGLIEIPPGADRSEAHLKTANLLLSAHAEIDTKPELIIEADEIACSHGATVGQLDERALFYLRSRGVPEAQARRMLTIAFGGDVLRAVDDTVREAMAAVVAEKVAK